MNALPPLRVPARDIPVPSSISPEAQAVLAQPMPPSPGYPALDDSDGWRIRIAGMDAALLPRMQNRASSRHVEDVRISDTQVFIIDPMDADANDRRVCLDIHGGALVMGSGPLCRAMGESAAVQLGMRLWAIDYRMPPDHPYPAALDDCIAAYRALLQERRPEEIVVKGGSAGGNLAAALMLRARDEGLPLPAAVLLLTPELDLTESGDSFRTNLGVDTILANSLMPANLLYAGGHDLAHPYLSPLFGDFSKGFPPTFLMSGTRDLFLSNTVRMHSALRGAGIVADLYILEAAPHGGFGGVAPEDRAMVEEMRRFVAAHCPLG